MSDYYEDAVALRVVDVWNPGNETGWVTPAVLYNRQVKAPDGKVKAPPLDAVIAWIDHGTAGANTLRFWGEGLSAVPGNWTVAHYLVPHERTQYKDGIAHDTSHVVFKMVPDGYGANHAGDCAADIDNTNSLGCEYESAQLNTHDISESQLIRGALLYAYNSARYRIRDHMRVQHGVVSLPWGRRRDPFSGPFDIAHSWEIVQAIRRDERIWRFWGLPQPAGGG